MITKETIEAWHAKAAVLRARGKNNTLHDIEQAADYLDAAAAFAAMPGPAVKASAFEFDRYINGILMAEGVAIERETNFEAAAASAARIASRGPNGEAPVLVMRTSATDIASENERLRAALERVAPKERSKSWLPPQMWSEIRKELERT